MSTHRKKPEIDKRHSFPAREEYDDPLSCLLLPIFIVISYFVLSAIIRVMSNSGSNLDRTICYGTLIFFVILMLRGVQAEYQASKARKAEREAWEKGCKTASLVIVRRSPALSWWDDSAYRPMRTPDSLELEMNSDQKVASPTQTTVYVNVSPHVYKHLEKSSTVRIYYMPESPLTFLLEDEL